MWLETRGVDFTGPRNIREWVPCFTVTIMGSSVINQWRSYSEL